MLSSDQYLDIIENAIENIDYPAHPSGLYQPIKYALETGGKRIRPMLTLAACDALGVDVNVAVDQALAIEMFHNFTLLHDDVMDKAEVRRGRPTVHQRWNEQTAILSGDAMLTMSQMMASRCAVEKLPSVLALFNKTAMEVYEGQQYDMDFEHRKSVSAENYMEMIRLKTSVLIGCAVRMGALMAGADENTQQAFYDYGEKLGLAFQLRDDYLDTFGDPTIFGKAIGGDIVNDKKTWLLITAMSEDRSGTIEKWLGNQSDKSGKIEAVTGVYRFLKLDERCSELVNRYCDEAVAQLNRINLSVEAREFFVELAMKSRARSN